MVCFSPLNHMHATMPHTTMPHKVKHHSVVPNIGIPHAVMPHNSGAVWWGTPVCVDLQTGQDSRRGLFRDGAADDRDCSGGRTQAEGREGAGGEATEGHDEAPPPRPLPASDATTRKRNRKIFGALLLGTLEVSYSPLARAPTSGMVSGVEVERML